MSEKIIINGNGKQVDISTLMRLDCQIIVDEIDLSLEELEATIKDQDFEDFETFLEQESEADNYFLSRGDY